jgi:hypothetical protein
MFMRRISAISLFIHLTHWLIFPSLAQSEARDIRDVWVELTRPFAESCSGAFEARVYWLHEVGDQRCLVSPARADLKKQTQDFLQIPEEKLSFSPLFRDLNHFNIDHAAMCLVTQAELEQNFEVFGVFAWTATRDAGAIYELQPRAPSAEVSGCLRIEIRHQ